MSIPIDVLFTKSDEEEKEFANWCQAVEEAFELIEECCSKWELEGNIFSDNYNQYNNILVKAGRR